jgi:hypothetical protein
MVCPTCHDSRHSLSQCRKAMTTTAVAARNARSALPATAPILAEPLATGRGMAASSLAPSWLAHGSDAQHSNGEVREVHPMWKTFGQPSVQPSRKAGGAEVRQEGCDTAGCGADQVEGCEAGEAIRSADEAAAGGPGATGVGLVTA